jgi:aminoglycoside phosphotransferase (APT) family kinase protein
VTCTPGHELEEANGEVQASLARRAVAAARSTASTFDLPVDAAVVLNDSNRLVVRLMPCDVVARVTPPAALASVTASASWLSGEAYQARLATEVEVVKRFAETDSPVAGLDPRFEPRVYVQDGFAITMWTYFAPVRRMLPSADYAQVLECLHAGLRQIDVPTPHFMDRVAATQQLVASRDVTPDLAEIDRVVLANTLRDLSETIVGWRAAEQILHGEPHPGNVLKTMNGPLFMDFEDSVRGPVEFDLAWVPREVSERYPDADQALVGEFRGVVLAMIAAHRWSRDDQHPSGRQSGVAFLNALREGPPWPPHDAV